MACARRRRKEGDPSRHYRLTVAAIELTDVERDLVAAASADEVDFGWGQGPARAVRPLTA